MDPFPFHVRIRYRRHKGRHRGLVVANVHSLLEPLNVLWKKSVLKLYQISFLYVAFGRKKVVRQSAVICDEEKPFRILI